MKTLGVTGGIGSGKSTVCRMLEEQGAEVFYADAEAKALMEDDPAVRSDVIAAFGPASYDAAGRLNRAYLAAAVFGDPVQVARINAIVHPRVYQRFEVRKRDALERGVPLLVHEAALIFEAGGEQYLDAVAVVEAPREARIVRVVARDGVAPEAVEARMAHQFPPDELRRRADFVIENTGTLADLRTRVEALYRQLVPDQEAPDG
jgi:dephospho-CoA kinase